MQMGDILLLKIDLRTEAEIFAPKEVEAEQQRSGCHVLDQQLESSWQPPWRPFGGRTPILLNKKSSWPMMYTS